MGQMCSHAGHIQIGSEAVSVEFCAPITASVAEKDAAFMAALAQVADINYLSIGTYEDPATEALKPVGLWQRAVANGETQKGFQDWLDQQALQPADDEAVMFVNHYRCSCGEEWEDTHSAACNDRCPQCNKEIEPYKSEDLDVPFDVEVSRTGYACRTIQVMAKTRSDAEGKALDIAGGYEFSEHHSQYGINSASKA